ncbi:hypothetical protein CCACVL1_12125 [Corchorus capsularis]|uniref:AP2/ERF domain-containing protein n=1 Tax=Corchorus capsularis TaxID=210143 RepID=A0A1R3IH97_COCAP|nr:hypothetical protein CCACVL1_12125 [Corchorus capsularis]
MDIQYTGKEITSEKHHQQARIGRVLAGFEDFHLGTFIGSTEEEAAIAYEYFAEAMSRAGLTGVVIYTIQEEISVLRYGLDRVLGLRGRK